MVGRRARGLRLALALGLAAACSSAPAHAAPPAGEGWTAEDTLLFGGGFPVGLRVLPSVDYVELWTVPERRSGQAQSLVARCSESCPLRILPGRYKVIVRERGGLKSEKELTIQAPVLLTAVPAEGGSDWGGAALILAGAAAAVGAYAAIAAGDERGLVLGGLLLPIGAGMIVGGAFVMRGSNDAEVRREAIDPKLLGGATERPRRAAFSGFELQVSF